MPSTQMVKKILNNYEGDTPGVKANLAGVLCTEQARQRQQGHSAGRKLTVEAKSSGLAAAVAWSYPRGPRLDEAVETALDICAYGAQMAARLGATSSGATRSSGRRSRRWRCLPKIIDIYLGKS
jgi:hypothetical protein